MPKGGFRIGAGRKPTGSVVAGKFLAAPPPVVTLEEAADLQQPPEALSAGAKAWWGKWAGRALVERTLTPSTAAGFAQLCEQGAYLDAVAARIDQIGAGTQEAGGYLVTYMKLAARLDASLHRFRLTAEGKPMAEKAKAANPWVAVGMK